MDELARVLFDVLGELLLRLVLGHGARAQFLLLLRPYTPALWVLSPEMEISDPDLPFALPILLLNPSFRRMDSRKSLGRFAADAVEINVDYGRENGCRSVVVFGGRGGERERPGCALCHGRSIGASASGQQLSKWVGKWVGVSPAYC